MKYVKHSALIVSLALSLMVLSGNGLAIGLEYYGVEVTINEDHSVTNMIVLKFDTPANHLDYNLDFRIDSLEFESDFDFADCSASNNNGGSTISCDFIGMTNESNKLTLTFNTRNVIKRIDDTYRFTVNYGIPLPIQNSFILIRLPQNNILAGEQNESFFPTDGQTLTDGKYIMVFWEDEALETGESLMFSILFTRPAFGTEIVTLFIYSLIIVVIVLAVLGAIYFKKIRSSKVAVVKSVLNRDEKSVIDILNQKGGHAGQKVLVRETDFSKAKVSRIVKNLKDRGVVDTEPISGRENKVMIMLDRPQDRKDKNN
jgi:uncharacterized membrane protein